MPDSRPTEPERLLQGKFSKLLILRSLLVTVAVLAFAHWLNGLPDRPAAAATVAEVEYVTVQLPRPASRRLRLVGAWELRSADPRVGGISGLALSGDALVALSDAGTAIRLPRPRPGRARALVLHLPDGPGTDRFKRNRDSEAIARDPPGRGWWVSFENRHQLWLYDTQLTRALASRRLPAGDWGDNAGIEAIAAGQGGLLLIHEGGRFLLRAAAGRLHGLPLIGTHGRISDAASLPSGRLLLVERTLTPLGFRNALRLAACGSGRCTAGAPLALPVGPLANVEAVAVESLGPRRHRLWLMTDDGHQKPFRTLVLAIDYTE